MDHAEIMVLPIHYPQEYSVYHLVMLSSAKHLAKQWPGWARLDPSTPPGSALDDKVRIRASYGLSSVEGPEP